MKSNGIFGQHIYSWFWQQQFSHKMPFEMENDSKNKIERPNCIDQPTDHRFDLYNIQCTRTDTHTHINFIIHCVHKLAEDMLRRGTSSHGNRTEAYIHNYNYNDIVLCMLYTFYFRWLWHAIANKIHSHSLWPVKMFPLNSIGSIRLFCPCNSKCRACSCKWARERANAHVVCVVISLLLLLWLLYISTAIRISNEHVFSILV